MARERRDVVGINCVKDKDSKIVVEPEKVKQIWKEYMERLLNEKNKWNGLLDNCIFEGPEKLITEAEVWNAIGQLKNGKAGGPTGLVGEIFKASGSVGVKAMAVLCNKVLFEGTMPRDWELSTLVPI